MGVPENWNEPYGCPFGPGASAVLLGIPGGFSLRLISFVPCRPLSGYKATGSGRLSVERGDERITRE